MRETIVNSQVAGLVVQYCKEMGTPPRCRSAALALGVFLVGFVILVADSSSGEGQEPTHVDRDARDLDAFVCVLGIAQDGGYPQLGCRRECCQRAWRELPNPVHVVSLAIIDPVSRQRWLVECTPDFKSQWHALDQLLPVESGLGIDGILLTHAHIGHYTGLIHLGREAFGGEHVPVYAMPRMQDFLRRNGPWSLCVELRNIELRTLKDGQATELNKRIRVTPISVPHRDEFSETVAFRIAGPNHAVLFLPDIDKWERWEKTIEKQLAAVDAAYLDATFFDGDELPGRNMSEIPHPFVVETIQRFAVLPPAERNKVRLIHLNHTNPLWDPASPARNQIRRAGLRIAEMMERVRL
jgi:pyrroloquinoline quinone biosynthesis protein B